MFFVCLSDNILKCLAAQHSSNHGQFTRFRISSLTNPALFTTGLFGQRTQDRFVCTVGYGKAFTAIGLVFVLDVKGSDRKSPNKKQNNTCWPLVRDFVLWFVTSGGNLNNLVSCHDLNIHSSNYWNHSCCVGAWRHVGSAKTVVFCYHAVVGVWNENDDMRSKWINRKLKLQPNDKLTIKCRFFDTVEYWKQTLMKRIGLK